MAARDAARTALAVGEPSFAVGRLGCGLMDYREQAQQIELKTGGMAATPHVLPDDAHLDTYEQVALCLRVSAAPGRASSISF